MTTLMEKFDVFLTRQGQGQQAQQTDQRTTTATVTATATSENTTGKSTASATATAQLQPPQATTPTRTSKGEPKGEATPCKSNRTGGNNANREQTTTPIPPTTLGFAREDGNDNDVDEEMDNKDEDEDMGNNEEENNSINTSTSTISEGTKGSKKRKSSKQKKTPPKSAIKKPAKNPIKGSIAQLFSNIKAKEESTRIARAKQADNTKNDLEDLAELPRGHNEQDNITDLESLGFTKTKLRNRLRPDNTQNQQQNGSRTPEESPAEA
jgi:hypothetical protein